MKNTTNVIREVYQAHGRDGEWGGGDSSFLKFWLSLENSTFIIGSKYYQLFSLKWQAHFVHFQENVCIIPKSEKSWVISFPFKLKWCYMKTASSLAGNSNTGTSNNHWVLETIYEHWYAAETIQTYFSRCHTEFKMCAQGLKCSNSNNFYWHLFFLQVSSGEEHSHH